MPGSPHLILLLIACAGAGVGAFLYTMAAKIAWEIRVHELRVQTHRLRIEQDKKLAMLRSAQMGEPDAEIAVKLISTPGDAGHPEMPSEQRKAA